MRVMLKMICSLKNKTLKTIIIHLIFLFTQINKTAKMTFSICISGSDTDVMASRELNRHSVRSINAIILISGLKANQTDSVTSTKYNKKNPIAI